MKPGQRLTSWWQRYVLGGFKAPQDLFRSAATETPDNATSAEAFFGRSDPSPVWDAPQRLAAPAFFFHESYLRQSHKADWQHADPRLMRWAALFIEYARKRGIPLYVHRAFRTETEQAKAFAHGTSKVEYPNSAHNTGQAVDIVHSVYHWELTAAEWQLLHVLGLKALERINTTLPKAQQLQLKWGGDFMAPNGKPWPDPAHWEVLDYRNRIKRLPVGPPINQTPRKILSRS